MNYYKLLGVSYDAPQALIRARYRLLAFNTHPDLVGDGNASQSFERYAEAYGVLGHPTRRQAYNAQMGIQLEPRPLKAGHDLHQRLTILPAQAEYGTSAVLRFLRYDPCSLCWCAGCHRCKQQGLVGQWIEVAVKIPKGMRQSTMLVVEGEGGQTEPGGPRGDLLVHVSIGDP